MPAHQGAEVPYLLLQAHRDAAQNDNIQNPKSGKLPGSNGSIN